VNEFSELYADPKYFFCDRRGQEIRLGVCIGMQKANAEKDRPGSSDPFPVCTECDQGDWNRRFRGVWTDGSPKRGKGQRDAECRRYDACLNIAVKKDWRSWNCESCPYFMPGNENRVEKPENTGLCEKCGEKPKFGRSPYCASCMARKSNEARKGKKTKKTKPRRGRKKAGHTKDKAEKSPPRDDTAVITIDFGKYAPILRKIERLAEEEIRSVESQVIYMLKTCLKGSGEVP
jgi:hypothetical protein